MANAENGDFVWYELFTTDPKAAIAFYSELFGWKTEPFGDGSYQMWVSSQGPLGGVVAQSDALKQAKAPPRWAGSVQVANVDAACTAIKQLGGKVTEEPTDIPTVGRYAAVADAQGAQFALFAPGGGPMLKHDASQAGEMCWAELITSDPDAAVESYGKLFGWTVQAQMPMPEGGIYRMFGTGDARKGGVMKIPPGAPPISFWVFYFSVTDANASIDRAKKMGAKLLAGPMDVPGGGRIAQLMDPQGAMFALHQAPKGGLATL